MAITDTDTGADEADEFDPSICRLCGDPLRLHPAGGLTLDQFKAEIQKADDEERGCRALGQREQAREHLRRGVRLRCAARRAYGQWLP